MFFRTNPGLVLFLSITLLISLPHSVHGTFNIFTEKPHVLDIKYGIFPESLRLKLLSEARSMFFYGYVNYKELAFPKDELNPIYCRGRGPDYDDPSNININDILGDFCLTLVDSLDTLAIIGNISEFKKAVTEVVQYVNFDTNNVIQVFEANIRLLGGLISAHLLIDDPEQPFGNLKPEGYDNELLYLAHDLATRLLPAFEESPTGIPYPRVNLRYGVPANSKYETCPAGAGSLVLEFGLLSRLLGDPVYEGYARRATKTLWNRRSEQTGLLGNVIDADSGVWVGRLSGLGAGLDSFYEYLLKSYVMFGEKEDLYRFTEVYQSIKKFMRRGRAFCNSGIGDHPIYVNVHMLNGVLTNTWIDSLQAAFSGVQVLFGDIEEAICSHALYYSIWKHYGLLPERWNWQKLEADVSFYPLRPEFVESTYLLYQATKNPFYLHVGKDILESLNKYTKTECGYATVHNVIDKSLEDRMESFFLSETCKYLYLLFDFDNHVNRNSEKYLFSTEGHLLPIRSYFRNKPWLVNSKTEEKSLNGNSSLNADCHSIGPERTYFTPLRSFYLFQIFELLGVVD